MNIYQKITIEEFIQIFNTSISKGDICRKLNIPNNGKSIKYINSMIEKLSLNEETIKDNYFNYYNEEKVCPYCGKKFFTKRNGKESKQICCSVKCSNNYNKNDGRYEKISSKLSDKCKDTFKKDVKGKEVIDVIEKICQRCGKIYYSNKYGFIKSKYCPICKNQRNTKYKCELRKTICNKCGKVIYVKTFIEPNYCMNCYHNNVELKNIRHYQEFDINGKKIYSEKYRKNISKKIQENIKNGLHKGWKSRNIVSYPERFFQKVLKLNNIDYDFNHVVHKRDLGVNDSSSYFLDFFIRNDIDLEVDGKQHQLPERAESDKIRDELLTKSGYKVYRIKWNEINSKEGKELMKQKINDFLEWYKFQSL